MANKEMESKEGVRHISPLSYLDDVVRGVEKLRVASQVRLTHLERQGREDKHTEAVLVDLQRLEDNITGLLKGEMEQHPAWPWLKEVKGAGLENTAKVIGIIEGVNFKSTGRSGIAAFDTMSKLRRFAGLAPVDGKSERRIKGEKLHYSSELRTMLWRLTQGLMRANGKFYDYYIHKKEEYTIKFVNHGIKILPTPKGGWRCVNCHTEFEMKNDVAGCCGDPSPDKVLKKETPGVFFLGHLDAMAKRKVTVMFSDMLWKYWRHALGLPCRPSYIAGKEPVRQHEPDDFIG